MNRSKLLRVLLVAILVVGLMPSGALAASAEVQPGDTNATGSTSSDVFSALGFDTSKAPQGYDADSTENPYGTDLVRVNETLEPFILDDTGFRLAGDDATISPASIGNGIPRVPLASPGAASYRTLAAGDFDGDGLSGEMALLAFTAADQTTPDNLKLFMMDETGVSAQGVTIAPGKNLSPVWPWLPSWEVQWRNVLQLATGDFDGDGRSEIAVYRPESGNAGVDIYKYEKTSDSVTGDWKSPDKWSVAWSYALCTDAAAPNMVSLCAGDFDRDGIDDLAVSHGSLKMGVYEDAAAPYRMRVLNGKPSTAVVLSGSKTAMLQRSRPLPLGDEPMARAAFAFGDVDGDDKRELVVGAQPMSDAAANTKRSVGVYGYDGESLVLTGSVQKVVDGQVTESGGWLSHNGFDGVYRSLPLSACNIAVVTPQVGRTRIYLDSVLYEYDSGTFKIAAELDDADVDLDGKPDTLGWGGVAGAAPVPYWEHGAKSGDVVGDGTSVLLANFVEWPYESPRKHDVKVLYGSSGGPLAAGRLYGTAADGEYLAQATAFPNTDKNDTVIMRYTGKHYISYTNPKVLAAIASPPYFKDVADTDPGYLGGLETSFGRSDGSGTARIWTRGVEAGAYGRFQVKGGLLAKAFIEGRLSASFTYEYEHEVSDQSEYSVQYTAPGGEDSVAFYSIPAECFVYEIAIPDGTGGYSIGFTTKTIPHTAAVQVLTLDRYESIRKDHQDALPAIKGAVLGHTVGDPATYRQSTEGLESPMAYSGDWAGVSFGNGSIEQGFTITHEDSTTKMYGGGFAFEIGAGGGFSIGAAEWEAGGGVTFAFNGAEGRSDVDITGTTFTGSVGNMPVSAENAGYYYAWKLLKYDGVAKVKDAEYRFPVVTYLVKDVTAPPRLPADFTQDHERTTDSTVALTWTYDKPAAGFYVYRYFDFPEGGGSFLVGTIPASSYSITRDADGRAHRTYRFSDGSLTPYTSYRYQIQVERNEVPPRSGVSAVLEARTKPSSGYPALAISPASLSIYPDKNAVLRATVENLEDYGANPQYQWQRLAGTGWKDVAGATSPQLIFSRSGSGDAGSYRCRVNVVSEASGAAISAFTSAAVVGYAKRSVTFDAISAVDTPSGTRLTLGVANAHSDSGSIPSGRVTFRVRSAATGSDISMPGTLDATGRATVLAGVLPRGVFTVSAYYSGDGVFKSGYADTVHSFSGVGQGHWLDAPDTLTYGDQAPFRVYRIAKDAAGEQTIAEVPVVDQAVRVGSSPTTYSGDAYGKAGENVLRGGAAGTITLGAFFDDGGTPGYAEKAVVIEKRPMTIGIPSRTGAQGSPVDTAAMRPVVLAGSLVETDAAFLGANVAYTYTNTAGKVVGAASVPLVTGMYTVTGQPRTPLTANYDVTTVPGSYAVLGQIERLNARIRPFAGLYNGTLGVISPGRASTSDGTTLTCDIPAGTKTVLGAVPDPGYVVYDWYLDGVPQNNPANTFAHTMLSETANIEVQFVIEPNTLTFGAVGRSDGGTVTCVTDPSLASGSIVRRGTPVTFLAQPKAGFHFVEWRWSAIGSATVHSEGTPVPGGNSYSLSMPGKDAVLYAAFERDSYSLTLAEGLEAVWVGDHDHDATTPQREIVVSSSGEVPGDTLVTVRPKAGHVIETGGAWLAVGSQGTAAADGKSYSLRLTQDTRVQAALRRGQYTATVRFTDASPSSCGTITYTIEDPTDPSVRSGTVSRGTGSTTLSVPGGARLRVAVTSAEAYELVGWAVTGAGADGTSTEAAVELDAVAGDVDLAVTMREKARHDVRIGALPDPVASYRAAVNGHDFEPAAAETSLTVHAGDSLAVRVTPPMGQVVGYWMVDGKTVPATSDTYTFEGIAGDHAIAAILSSMTYCTITWPGVGAAENGIVVTPEAGYLPIVPSGGDFRFKVSAAAVGLAVSDVYANGARLTSDAAGVYRIPDVTRNQVIRVAVRTGVKVDGVDIGNLSGDGWSYDLNEHVLSLTSSGHRVSGAMTDPGATFSLNLGREVSTVTLDSLEMTASRSPAVRSERLDGVSIVLKGHNRVVLTHSPTATDEAVLSAMFVTFDSGSTGSLDLVADFPPTTGPASSLHGMVAQGVAMKGGRVSVTAKSRIDAGSAEYDVHGVLVTGPQGMAMTGGTLVIDTYSASGSYSGGYPHEVTGIHSLSGHVGLSGGQLEITASSAPGLATDATGIKVGTADVFGFGMLRVYDEARVVIDVTSGYRPRGVNAGMIQVDGGGLRVDARLSPAPAYTWYASCGLQAEYLTNTGGLTEVQAAGGNPLGVLGGWTVTGCDVFAGNTAASVSSVTPEDFLLAQQAFLQVTDAAVSILPAGSAPFDKSDPAETNRTFTVTCPRSGTTFEQPSEVAFDGVALDPLTDAVTIDDSRNPVLVTLEAAYLRTAAVGTHALSVTFPGGANVSVPVAVTENAPAQPAGRIQLTPSATVAYKGETVSLAAALSDVHDVADTELSWVLTGIPTSSGTRLDTDADTHAATLVIGPDETAAELGVRASFTQHPSLVSETVTLTVATPVTDVAIDPPGVTLYPKLPGANLQQFNATVSGLGGGSVSQDVTWSVWGNTRLATVITPDGSLDVDPAEVGFGGTLVVTAVSKGHPYVAGSVVVQLMTTSPSITTTSLPAGFRGVPYSARLSAEGDDPIDWSVDGGLPPGLTLIDDSIEGTPTDAGTFDVAVRATNPSGEDTTTLRIEISRIAPVANADAVAGYENIPVTVDVLANDSMPYDDPLSAELVSLPAHGSVTLSSSGIATYTPDPGWYGTDAFGYRATDGGADSDTATVTVTVREVRTLSTIEGPDRCATAVRASQVAFPHGAGTVVIATGYNWPDALGGAALAGAVEGPLLLTSRDSIPASVLGEIARLGATKAYVLGGSPAVSNAVEVTLRAKLGSGGVRRIGGIDRYETARAIAEEVVAIQKAKGGSFDGTVFLATGRDFPDAVAASPLAASREWPILLTRPTGLDAVTTARMRTMGVTRVVVLGGANAVPTEVERAVQLDVPCETERLGGVDRYATASAIAAWGVDAAGLKWDRFALATGRDFPDALAGGVLQGRDGSVLLLTPSTSLDPNAAAAITANRDAIHEARFLGGTKAVGDAVRDEVRRLLQ